MDGVIVDAAEHTGELGLPGDAVELGGLDQRVRDGGALAAAIGPGKELSLAAERDPAQQAVPI